jgi:hypothetical protein
LEKENNPALYLGSLKQQISDMIKGMEEAGIVDSPLYNSIKNASKNIDTTVHNSIKKALIDKFGEHGWVIKLDYFMVPVLNKGARRTDYRFVLKNIAWKNGPGIHEVHYFVIEHFVCYLQSSEFDFRVYSRVLPGIEKRYVYKYIPGKQSSPIEVNIREKRQNGKPTEFKVVMNDPRVISSFVPLPINNKYFMPITVFISKIRHKINEKEMQQYFQLTVNEPRYMIDSIQGNTMSDLFTQLQEALETNFYQRENTPKLREANAFLMKNMIISASAEPPGPTQPLVRNKEGDPEEAGEDPVEEASETPEQEAAEEQQEAEANQDHSEEGEGLSGTDQPDTLSDSSIPQEESNFDMGGTPPSQEMIDHNYHDDSNPGLVKDFLDESGGIDPEEAGENEAAEEAGEDPAEEAGETPEEEAAEEQQEEASESGAEASIGQKNEHTGHTIDDLMSRDKIVQSLIKH